MTTKASSSGSAALRRSSQTTAGQHSYPHHLQGPVWGEENRAAGTSGPGTAIFWTWAIVCPSLIDDFINCEITVTSLSIVPVSVHLSVHKWSLGNPQEGNG